MTKDSTLHKMAKAKLLEYWPQLTERQQDMFRRMYSHKDLTATIEDITDRMPIEEFDHAIFQCENTIRKNNLNNS